MQSDRTAVFGPGLIGGSVALAARRGGVAGPLALWSRDKAERDAVRRLGLADTLVTGDAAEAVRGAGLVILCTPPASLPALAAEIAPYLEPETVISDVASVRTGVAEELTAIFERPGVAESSRHVGAHPMAGGERSGLAAARANLFDGCVCLLTPLEGRTSPEAAARVTDFWEGLGARVRRLTPVAHDEAVALVSHLPHLLAAALAGLPGEKARACAGPGWRDMTRLAAGSPELWTEILSRNRSPVKNALEQCIGRLRGVLELLETGGEAGLEGFLRDARAAAAATARRAADEGTGSRRQA